MMGGNRENLDQMVRKISESKADKGCYTEWDSLTQGVEDLAEYAGIDISDCESPSKVCALVLAEMKKRLMPDGCEWPKFDDGLPVRFGELAKVRDDLGEVAAVSFDEKCWRVTIGLDGDSSSDHYHFYDDMGGSLADVDDGERVTRYVEDTYSKLMRDTANPSYMPEGFDGGSIVTVTVSALRALADEAAAKGRSLHCSVEVSACPWLGDHARDHA